MGSFLVNNYKAKYTKVCLPPNMSIDIQKWKNEAHENAAKTVANMLQVGIVCMKFILGKILTEIVQD